MDNFFQRQLRKVQRRFNWGIKAQLYSKSISLFNKNGYQICYNKFTPKQYDPSKKNILFLIESPAMVEHHWDEWIKPDMEFYAEVSFHNFLNLPRYKSCRTLYATCDNWVDLLEDVPLDKKSALVSLIYSDKQTLEGHKLRYEIAQKYGSQMDLLGSGVDGKFLAKKDSLTPYMFQVVIENGQYPDYVSEKFFDCLKTKTVPVYWGGREGVEKMGFDKRGIIFFENADELGVILANQVTHENYKELRPFIDKNHTRLKEIRQDIYMDALLNPILINGYFGTTKSYYGFGTNSLSIDF